jgi:hypothetical protein
MTSRAELIAFIDEVRAAYPDWRQRDLIANFRRAIPGYAEGVWTAAMPFNSGPSNLPVAMRERLCALLQADAAESGVDLGHVLVCLDLAANPDTIDDHFASWAGDLGLHALVNYLDGTDVPIGLPDPLTHAARPDLLADLDGEVLARRVEPGRELDAVIAYYADRPPSDPEAAPPIAAAHVSRRFRLFLADNDLLDERGVLRADAAAPDGFLYRAVARFVFWEQLKNHLAHFRPGRLLRLAAHGDFHDEPALRAAIGRTVEEFVEFLRAGLAEEVSSIQ